MEFFVNYAWNLYLSENFGLLVKNYISFAYDILHIRIRLVNGEC